MELAVAFVLGVVVGFAARPSILVAKDELARKIRGWL